MLKSRVYLPVIGCILSFLALTMPPLILPRRYLSGVCTHNRHISPSDVCESVALNTLSRHRPTRVHPHNPNISPTYTYIILKQIKQNSAVKKHGRIVDPSIHPNLITRFSPHHLMISPFKCPWHRITPHDTLCPNLPVRWHSQALDSI